MQHKIFRSSDTNVMKFVFEKEDVAVEQIAKNDGLSVADFVEWFFGSSKSNVFEGVVIHFTDFRY